MAILVDQDTRLVVSGITGREGTFHSLRNRDYGTNVVAQAGGKPANFLDAGGGSKAEAITSAVEVILSDDKVSAVLFNIFGGITRCDEVARGLIEAFEQIKPDVPFVVRLDGTNDTEGRALLAEANLPNVHTEATMLGAAEKVVELAK